MLALVGSGEYLPPMEPVDRYLMDLLPGLPRVVCLPTAAGNEGPERIDYWSDLGVQHFTRLGATVESIPVIDWQSAHNPDLASRIRSANFVYLSGGRPGYLYQTLKGSPAWQAIQYVIEQGGVLAGCSAGAMILGGYIPSFPGRHVAFGLVSGVVIIPHFDELPSYLMRLMKPFLGKRSTLVGIEGNTAMIQQDSRYEVVGTGGVTIWQQQSKVRYIHGQIIPNLS